MSDPVEDLLRRRFPSYQEPLRVARKWNRGADPDDLARAARLLAGLA